MKLRNISKYAAKPSAVFMTLLILLIALMFSQAFIQQIVYVIAYKDRAAPSSRPEDPNSRIHLSTKNFLPDGTIHLRYILKHSRAGLDYSNVQISGADGNLLWEGLHKDIPFEYLSWSERYQAFTASSMKELQMITPELSQTLQIPVSMQDEIEQIWRYEPKVDLFVGYRFKGDKIGYAGSTGFSESKVDAKPFGEFKNFTAWCPEDSFNPTLLWQTDRTLYEINFEKQQVEQLFESFGDEIKTVWQHRWIPSPVGQKKDSAIEYRPLISYLTEEGKIYLLFREPQESLTITIPEEWDTDTDTVSFASTKDKIFLRQQASDVKLPSPTSMPIREWRKLWNETLRKPHKRWVELYKLNNEGNLELINRFDWIQPAQPPVSIIEDLWLRTRVYVTKVSPPAYDLVWFLFYDKLDWMTYSGGIFQELTRVTEYFRPHDSVLNWILSMGMMVFAFWHGWPRRTRWATVIFWLVFIGLFNLMGLLTYLALNHTTVIKCPVCGRNRGLERVDCVRCGGELPIPKRKEHDLIFNS
ncbi:hypothetical protein ACFL1G_01655 [Planctomycetota bacterium]